VPGLVDLEDRPGPAYLRVGGVALHPRLRLAPDPEPAGGEVVGLLELDRDRARGRRSPVLSAWSWTWWVSSSASALSYGERPVEVDLAELDVEVVGHHPPLAAEDLRVVVALALQRRGDLHRLHRGAEGPGERRRR
jgi:hypothetical protein